MLVQHYESHGRHFTNVHCYYYYKAPTHPLTHPPTHPVTCMWVVKQYNADQVKGKQSVSVAVQFTRERLHAGHKAKDITPLIAWKEEVLDNLPWKDERGPSSTRQTLEPFQRQRWENFRETGFSECIDTLLIWTELNWTELNLSMSHQVVLLKEGWSGKSSVLFSLYVVLFQICTRSRWPMPTGRVAKWMTKLSLTSTSVAILSKGSSLSLLA